MDKYLREGEKGNMLKKKSTIIALAIAGVLVVVLAVLGVKFFILDASKIEITENFEGIPWGTTAEQAKRLLQGDGYNVLDRKTLIFEIEEYGGYEGIKGLGAMPGVQGDQAIQSILLMFKDEDMGEKELDKFAKAVKKELDSMFDKKVSAKQMEQIMREEYAALHPDKELEYYEIESIYYGDVSCIQYRYVEGVQLYIEYMPLDDTYAKAMMKYAE